MKVKILCTMVAIALLPLGAQAADGIGMRKGGYGKAGCGLGSMVFESNDKPQQVLAATTNGTFGSQTFGISSGTSNCSADGVVLNEKKSEVFVAANFTTLHQEMAKGGGENLNALAYLMGCEAGQFTNGVKSNYSTLGATSEPLELLHSLETNVASSCQ